jgi:hypothetical protein
VTPFTFVSREQCFGKHTVSVFRVEDNSFRSEDKITGNRSGQCGFQFKRRTCFIIPLVLSTRALKELSCDSQTNYIIYCYSSLYVSCVVDRFAALNDFIDFSLALY